MSDRNDTFDWLPASARPCVWMTAGLVAYRLCDRDFDCERCPLDAALRGDASPPPPTREGARWGFPDDRLYSPRHAWVQAEGEGRVRTGLDVFAARLLGPVHAVVLPNRGARVRRGSAACWAMSDTDLVPLAAPVSGTVTRVNRALQERPGGVNDAPYDDGWLLEVEVAGAPEEQTDLVPAAISRRNAEQEVARLGREIRRGRGGDIGPALPDGGEMLPGLSGLLSPARRRRLLRRLLC